MSTVRMEVKEPTPYDRRVETVGDRLQAYEHRIRDYLANLEANVEYYKFAVEKHGDGLEVEVSIKAIIHPKNKPKQPTTP